MPGVLIADDLPVIRSGIVHILEQYQVPMRPFIEATDGKDAVLKARQYKSDIILMDIKMPNLDGLQAAAQIRAEQQDAKIVMLTAYDEFSYIQKAMKLGSRDYLLKPVRPARLIELIEEIQKEIREERRNLRTIELVKDSLQKTLPVIETNLVENLIRGTNPDGATAEESLAFLGKRLSQPAVMVAKMDNYEEFAQGKSASQMQAIYLSLVETVRRQLPNPQQALVGYSKPGRIIAILSCDQSLASVGQICALADRIRQAVKRETAYTVTIGIGNRYSDWEAIPLSYAEANLARRYQSYHEGNKVIHIDHTSAVIIDRNDETAYRIQHEQDIITSIQSNDQQRAIKLVNEVVDYLTQRFKSNPEGFKYSCAELVTLVAWAVIGSGVDQRTVLNISHNQVMNLDEQKSMLEVRTWTMNSLAEYLAVLQTQSSDKKDAVSQAIDYIRANYSRDDISLQEVAEAVNLSQSYLGAQLKERLGVGYIKYLTDLRIEEAKRLLRLTDLSILYIAQKVGYPNVTNFYRHFQRLVGSTPTAYREKERIS